VASCNTRSLWIAFSADIRLSTACFTLLPAFDRKRFHLVACVQIDGLKRPENLLLFVVFKKDMNIEHGFFHLFETLSSLRNSITKPASSEVETRLPKLDYSLLTSVAIHYGRHGPHELRLDRRPTHSHVRIRPVTQSGAASFESIVWIVSCLVAILGVVHAAHSEQPLLWLAVWPAPVGLACTIFTFFRHGFHFEDGVLVLGRQRE
jgi:hypothetical protein